MSLQLAGSTRASPSRPEHFWAGSWLLNPWLRAASELRGGEGPSGLQEDLGGPDSLWDLE